METPATEGRKQMKGGNLRDGEAEKRRKDTKKKAIKDKTLGRKQGMIRGRMNERNEGRKKRMNERNREGRS